MDAKEYMRRGVKNMENGDLNEAVADLTKMIELGPGDAATSLAYNKRGQTYGMKGENDLAIADLDKAIELGSRLAPINAEIAAINAQTIAQSYGLRGLAYGKKADIAGSNKDYKVAFQHIGQAIKDYEAALKIDPNYAVAKNALAGTRAKHDVLRELFEKEKSGLAKDSQAALKIDPNNAQTKDSLKVANAQKPVADNFNIKSKNVVMSRKELISASGKGHSAISLNWAIVVVSSVIIVAGIFITPSYFNAKLGAEFKKADANITSQRSAYDNPLIAGALSGVRAAEDKRIEAIKADVKNEVDGIVKKFIVFLIIMLALMLIWGFVFHANVSKNIVRVYEDCVKGLSINDWAQLTDFNIAYSQVSSVDVISGGKKLVIHAANYRYKIFAMNAGEVRDVIVAQKKAVG